MKKLYVTMPQPGETITEGTIVKWIAKVGDAVSEGTPLAELETEKALFEYESPFEGKILQILHGDQSRVPVATPIALMEIADDKAKQYIMLGIGQEVEGSTASSVSEKPQAVVAASVTDAPAKTPVESRITYGELKLSPYVRKLANEHSVSQDTLVSLASSHAEGRVTKEAIEAFIGTGKITASKPVVAATTRAASNDYDVLPFSPIRMRIAENMVKSKQTIPHAHTGLTVDMTNVLKYRETHKAEFQNKHGTSLSLLTLLLPTLVKAIQTYPGVNASFAGEGASAEIRVFRSINLAVAVGTEAGLMTPVIKDVAKLSSSDFAKKMSDVVDRANRKKLMPDDFSGTTFLFNNFGFFGLNAGTQIIQYPLAATLGMGALEKKVVPDGTGFAVRDTANFFLAFDHRVIDGLEAGKFLTMIKDGLEKFDFTV